MSAAGTILVVDDLPQNARLLEAVLAPRGHAVVTAASGPEALERLAEGGLDLVLLDLRMPGMDGFEVCRRLREDPATRFVPVIVVTASGEQEKIRALEAGADDFAAKPFDHAELLARVRSLLRLKRYHDTIAEQAAELERFNRQLEVRVQEQLDELQRVGRLRRFLAPQVADLVVSSGDDAFLQSHRREIAVVFCELAGFPAFADTVDPEDVMGVLAEYHAAVGDVIHRFEGTLERFTGDRLLVLFNDPLPCSDPPGLAVELALAMRDRVWALAERWSRLGYELQLAAGVDLGHATLGRIGFEGRTEYAAIGSPARVAERLCEAASPGQVLISQRVLAATEDAVVTHPVGELTLRGLVRPVRAHDLLALYSRAPAA